MPTARANASCVPNFTAMANFKLCLKSVPLENFFRKSASKATRPKPGEVTRLNDGEQKGHPRNGWPLRGLIQPLLISRFMREIGLRSAIQSMQVVDKKREKIFWRLSPFVENYEVFG